MAWGEGRAGVAGQAGGLHSWVRLYCQGAGKDWEAVRPRGSQEAPTGRFGGRMRSLIQST